MSIINIYHGDSIKAMESMPANKYGLAICDVNYGIKQDGRNNHTRGKLAKTTNYENRSRYDDESPDASYFDSLQMITENQILWGANHFIDKMPFNVSSPSWLVWDKMNGDSDFADCELAWTSFKTAVRLFKFRWAGMLQGDMKNKQKYIHPNMKPIQLYKWQLKNYGFNKDKSKRTIFDSHGGSMSIVIACIDMGFNIDIWEIDKDYYTDSVNRVKRHLRQLDLTREPVEINYITS